MNRQEIIHTIQNSILQPEIYLQLVAIIVCLFLAFITNKFSRRLLRTKTKTNFKFSQSRLNKIIVKYVKPLFGLILTMAILAIGMHIFKEFYNHIFLFRIAIKFIGLFLLFRTLKVFLGDSFIATLVSAFLLPIIMLAIFGLLDVTIYYLDSITFTMGKVKISAYTIIKASLTLLIVFWLSGLISRKSKAFILNNTKIVPNTKGVINKVIDILVYLIVFVILLKVLGINTTTFAVVGGAIGVGIGLGLQKIASNFIGGIILLFEKSIEIGDLVEIQGGIEGTITHFGGRYTLLETYDGKEIMVPNEDFIVNRVINLTYNNNRARIEIPVHVAYNSDLAKVEELMISVAKEHPRCLLYPAPEVFVVKFGEHAIELMVHFWINNVIDGRMRPKSDVMFGILKKFKENQILIPLPQREINLRSNVEQNSELPNNTSP